MQRSGKLAVALIVALAVVGGAGWQQFGSRSAPPVTITISPTTTTVPGSSTTATVTSTITRFRLFGVIFFDYNGNGKREKNEPPISGVTVALNGANLTVSNTTGWYAIDRVSKGEHSLRVYAPSKFRYMCESVAEFRRSDATCRFQVENDTRRDIGLMEGYLTLPFAKGTVETGPRVYVDVGGGRDWKGGANTYGGHLGTDFLMPIGTKLLAAAPGQVVYSYWSEDDGHVVGIMHPDGKLTLYAHLSERMVELKQNVTRGQVIGLSGQTGRLSGRNPHLHFQFGGYGTKRLDPYRDLLDQASLSYWTVDNDPQYPA